MGSWSDILEEIQRSERKDAIDFVRRQYLKQLHERTGRNVIAYYSSWLQKPNVQGTEIDDGDKNGFMASICGLDRNKGLDLILHTPGGQVAATESIVNYLRKMFHGDIVAYVPQISMSAGTMIACGCKEIVMGNHSNLGPIDPQFGGIPAFGVTQEFERAMKEVKKDPSKALVWKFIISKYHPTFIGECENAIKWSRTIVSEWLRTGMFDSETETNKTKKSRKVVEALQDRNRMLTHSRHLGIEECKEIGLNIKQLESDQELQDIVLSIHHSFMITFSQTTAIKLNENHEGKTYALHATPLIARQ